MQLSRLFLVLCSCLEFSLTAHGAGADFNIGQLQQDHPEKCGCLFKAPSTAKWNALTAFADLDGLSVWINVDGQDMRLEAVKAKSPFVRPRAPVGTAVRRMFQHDGVSAEIQCAVVAPNPGEEQMVRMGGLVMVKRGAQTESLKLVGKCGCVR